MNHSRHCILHLKRAGLSLTSEESGVESGDEVYYIYMGQMVYKAINTYQGLLVRNVVGSSCAMHLMVVA